MLFYILNFALFGVILLTLHLIYATMVRPKNFPPGPKNLPFLGSFYLITPELHTRNSGSSSLKFEIPEPKPLLNIEHFVMHSTEIPLLAKTYGNLFSLKIGKRNVICLVGYDIIKEVITDRAKEFADRLDTIMGRLIRGEEREGIAMSPYGPRWAANRKFLHTVFRNMGLKKHGISKCITDEVPAMTDVLERLCKNGQPVDPTAVIESAVLNVLAFFTFGDRYQYGDEKFKILMLINNDFFQKSKFLHNPYFFVMNLIPCLRKVWITSSMKQVVSSMKKILQFIEIEISRHVSTLDLENPRDLIDFYLIELRNKSNQSLSEKGLEMTLLDMFQAGTETTATTLRWAIVYLANNPHVQRKVHEEIDRVLGSERPKYEDRLKMPYCEATVLEVQRKATIAPIGLIHAPTVNTTIHGYNIPKQTAILVSYHSMHSSLDHWKNPGCFDPQNFLDIDGKVGTRDAFMPFGGGLRICVGMNLAKQELFVFFVGLLQKFRIKLPKTVRKIPEDPVTGLTLAPKRYEVILEPRF